LRCRTASSWATVFGTCLPRNARMRSGLGCFRVDSERMNWSAQAHIAFIEILPICLRIWMRLACAAHKIGVAIAGKVLHGVTHQKEIPAHGGPSRLRIANRR